MGKDKRSKMKYEKEDNKEWDGKIETKEDEFESERWSRLRDFDESKQDYVNSNKYD